MSCMTTAKPRAISTGPEGGVLLKSLRDHLAANPEKATSQDGSATARLEDDFRCRIDGSTASVSSDMPAAIGGNGAAPSPGWYLRAAVSACAATAIAMRAAELCIELSSLEVRVDSTSDDRGLFGVGDAAPGPLAMEMLVEISSPNASERELKELVAYADAHAPVGDAIRRSIPITSSLKVKPT